MRRMTAVLAAVGAMLVLYAGGALAQPQTPQQIIPDRYIVVLNDNVANPGQVANQHAQQQGAQVGFVYRYAIKGYSAVIPQNRLGAIENDPRVDYVEPDGVVSAIAQQDAPTKAAKPGGGDVSATAQNLPWGIDKIDADVSQTAAIKGDGGDLTVNAYIIDTGVDASHADLKVANHVNFAGGPNKDCNGHGTHVAGTVAAKDNTSDVVGAAPGASLTGVKVLGCGGSGTWSGVIKGIDWVTANAKKPAIANMSLGGGANKSVDDAVVKSANSGVFYSIAAGNDGADACNYSPARAGAGTNNGIATVAATDSNDKETSWSNYGKCVDIWAPGASILSTKSGGGTTTMSGTSMAAPHVGGGGALYLSSNTGAGAADAESALKSAMETTANKSKDGRTITRENVSGF